MRINNNIMALQTQLSLSKTSSNLSKSSLRLSSGVKINSSVDDSAALSLSNKMKSQIKSLEMASRNSLDGVSLIQTADGALNEVTNIIQRMRELSVQSANGTLTAEDREKIQYEVDGLKAEITSISNKTEFNNIKLLNGEASRMSTSSNEKIATTSYLSETVDPGILSYNIVSVGVPAKVSSTYPISTGVGGNLSINGETVEISPTDSPDEILNKIRTCCSYSNIEVMVDNANLTLVSTLAGSNQQISISSNNPALLASLNLPNGTSVGSDAVIDNIVFNNENGVPDTSFNNSKTVIIDGNHINFTSSNNRIISVDLQLTVNPDGVFQLKDGTIVSDTGVLGGPISMNSEILDYGGLILQVGQNKSMELKLQIPKVTCESLGLLYINDKTIAGSTDAIGKCDEALSKVSAIRGKLGAAENRLQFSNKSLDVTIESTQISLGRILDTDMAKEMTNYTKFNVISQAATSILAQANQRPQQILQLLK